MSRIDKEHSRKCPFLPTPVIISVLNEHKMNRIKEIRKREREDKGGKAHACVESNAIKVCRVGRNI